MWRMLLSAHAAARRSSGARPRTRSAVLLRRRRTATTTPATSYYLQCTLPIPVPPPKPQRSLPHILHYALPIYLHRPPSLAVWRRWMLALRLPMRRAQGMTASSQCGRRKRNIYAPYFDEMRAAHDTYLPMVLSCYGRWHPESAVTLERVCRQAARRLGIADHRPLLSRAHAAAGVAIWRRAVAMARACLPRLTPADCDAMLSGET